MEWTIVGVIVVLVGLVTAIVTPMIRLNTSITKLTCAVDSFQKNLDELTQKNADSHARLWRHNAEQDKILNGHETRLCVLERGGAE